MLKTTLRRVTRAADVAIGESADILQQVRMQLPEEDANEAIEIIRKGLIAYGQAVIAVRELRGALAELRDALVGLGAPASEVEVEVQVHDSGLGFTSFLTETEESRLGELGGVLERDHMAAYQVRSSEILGDKRVTPADAHSVDDVWGAHRTATDFAESLGPRNFRDVGWEISSKMLENLFGRLGGS